MADVINDVAYDETFTNYLLLQRQLDKELERRLLLWISAKFGFCRNVKNVNYTKDGAALRVDFMYSKLPDISLHRKAVTIIPIEFLSLSLDAFVEIALDSAVKARLEVRNNGG